MTHRKILGENVNYEDITHSDFDLLLYNTKMAARNMNYISNSRFPSYLKYHFYRRSTLKRWCEKFSSPIKEIYKRGP